jgi:hypothetical protein
MLTVRSDPQILSLTVLLPPPDRDGGMVATRHPERLA